ncbi:MAG: ATP-binding protein [Euryarchaeota archaeon]|nr:ATP-binding protein [Euryarchaeota archaeon]
MITKLALRNFKSMSESGIEIDLGPLTVLMGPNASGKSSIIEAIGIVAQSIDAQINSEGNLVIYRDFADVIHKRETNRWLTIKVCVNDLSYSYSFKKLNEEVRQSVEIGDIEIARVTNEFFEGHGQKPRFEYPEELAFKPCEYNPTRVLQKRVFTSNEPISDNLTSRLGEAQEIITKIRSSLENRVVFISSVRGIIPEVNRTDKGMEKPSNVGKEGEHLIHMLARIFGTLEYRDAAAKIAEWAGKFGINELHAGWRGANELISEYLDPSFGVVLNLSSASQGSRQILSIITQLFWSEPGDIIMIEEPEISLHPKSQVLLTELFAEAIAEGKQIIITTHSEFLPLALRRPIKNGLLALDDIALYHVMKDEGGTTAEKLDLTEDGYVKGWIPSFAEIEDDLLGEWIETVPED